MSGAGESFDAADFRRIVEDAYAPFLETLGFSLHDLHVSGRFYLAHFTSTTHRLSLGYEPGDDYLHLSVSDTPAPSLSDIDDRTRTPQIEDLNRRYADRISDSDRRGVDASFSVARATSPQEARLLEWARELRLVLPLHLRESASSR